MIGWHEIRLAFFSPLVTPWNVVCRRMMTTKVDVAWAERESKNIWAVVCQCDCVSEGEAATLISRREGWVLVQKFYAAIYGRCKSEREGNNNKTQNFVRAMLHCERWWLCVMGGGLVRISWMRASEWRRERRRCVCNSEKMFSISSFLYSTYIYVVCAMQLIRPMLNSWFNVLFGCFYFSNCSFTSLAFHSLPLHHAREISDANKK